MTWELIVAILVIAVLVGGAVAYMRKGRPGGA